MAENIAENVNEEVTLLDNANDGNKESKNDTNQKANEEKENANKDNDTTEETEKEKGKKTKKAKSETNSDKETCEKYKNLDSFIKSLKPQEQKTIKNFLDSSVYDTFMTYLEGIFREKDTLIHRINCFCFRAKEDVSVRVQGKIYEIKENEIIYIQKDSYGNSLLRNNKFERIM